MLGCWLYAATRAGMNEDTKGAQWHTEVSDTVNTVSVVNNFSQELIYFLKSLKCLAVYQVSQLIEGPNSGLSVMYYAD